MEGDNVDYMAAMEAYMKQRELEKKKEELEFEARRKALLDQQKRDQEEMDAKYKKDLGEVQDDATDAQTDANSPGLRITEELDINQ